MATFLEPYDLPCPLQGNPQPSCTWSIVNCSQLTPVDLRTMVTYKDNNCTLSIGVLNTTYMYANLCFYCNATNALAPNPDTAFINMILFIIKWVFRQCVMSNATIVLIGHRGEREKERRERNSEWKGSAKEKAWTPVQTSPYTLKNASENNIGTYSCYYYNFDGGDFPISTFFIDVRQGRWNSSL